MIWSKKCVCMCVFYPKLPVGIKKNKNWGRRTFLYHKLAERPWSKPGLGHGIATYGDAGCVTQNSRTCFSWYDIFKVMKENNCQRRILHPMKIFFKNEGKIKIVGTNKSWENSSPTELHYRKFFRQRKMMPVGNVDLRKGIKSTRNSKHGVNAKNFFSLKI